jgi:signal transduction histidine kinase
MNYDVVILIFEAMAIYLLVLGAHALRHRVGSAPFYTILGGITAVMSWVTDAGVQVELAGITFMVGSTVFYTALLLGVFVVYVFDGPRATRTAILTIAGISTLVPLIAAVLHLQMHIFSSATLNQIPLPSLRINTASVIATVLDLVFLAMAWEILGSPLIRINTWFRSFLALLGVMWLDVVLFSTGAFLGTPNDVSIMEGTLYSRLVISLFASPFLYAYLRWQSQKLGCEIENRPILAIVKEVAEIREELSLAQQEIERRKQVELELHRSEERYRRLAQYTDQKLEADRSGLADDLHDHLGQMLTALKIDLSACETVVAQTPDVKEKAGEMHRLLSDGIQRVHLLCRQLRPGSLDDIGIEGALQGLTADWSEYNGILCELNVQNGMELKIEQRTALFRLVQEALSNVSKHAHATHVAVSLRHTQNRLVVSVADNGCGMEAGAEKKPTAFGLLGMRERIEALGGSLHIESTLREGTRIEGAIPI